MTSQLRRQVHNIGRRRAWVIWLVGLSVYGLAVFHRTSLGVAGILAARKGREYSSASLDPAVADEASAASEVRRIGGQMEAAEAAFAETLKRRGLSAGDISAIREASNAGDLTVKGCYDVWQTREASAHYQVESSGRIGQLVHDRDNAKIGVREACTDC